MNSTRRDFVATTPVDARTHSPRGRRRRREKHSQYLTTGAHLDGTNRNSLLVGSDARSFALAHGFTAENIRAGRTRDNWELWKRIRSSSHLPENSHPFPA